ncbi:glycosyltransferase family 2 protein [Paenibacillus dokdonensis]|uniref:glycosyltransferase family 2 protein n=1 Tax=Paenibacillus dokdonensis TaxID=2567944 RepID=UPI001457B915|nr:glycosyltransferase family A protein [Paenibacillus dokdonensis]
MNALQTEISLRETLPGITPVRLPELDTAAKLNDILATYDEAFFLTLYAGDTIKPAFKEQLQQWQTEMMHDFAGIIIQPFPAAHFKESQKFECIGAILWRMSAVIAEPNNGFTDRSHLPFDHFVLIDKEFQLLASYSWLYVTTDTIVPSRADILYRKNNHVEEKGLLPLLKGYYAQKNHQQDQTPDPLISIVLCTYNNANYLPWAVRSVLAQTYKNWELIIVDDRSTDGTQAFLNSLEKDPRIQCLIQKQNQGKAACLNRALMEIRGIWLLELDADDWLTGDCLQKLAEEACGMESVDVIYADHHEWTERLNGMLIYRGVKHSPPTLTYQGLLEKGLAIAPRMFLTKSLKDGNGWNTSAPWNGRLYEDIEILARFAKKETLHYIPLPLYNRRIRSSSITHIHAQEYKKWSSWMLDQNF